MKVLMTFMGRKFFMAESTIICAWVFLWVGKLDQSGFVTLVLGVAGLFFGANVIDKKNKKDTLGEG